MALLDIKDLVTGYDGVAVVRGLCMRVDEGAVVTSAGCGISFKDRRTPSGDFCSDMLVIPAGQVPDREHHRLDVRARDLLQLCLVWRQRRRQL